MVDYECLDLIFERFVVWCGFWEQLPKTCVIKRGWTMCSEYDNHSKFNIQRNLGGGGDMYDQFKEHEKLHFDIE